MGGCTGVAAVVGVDDRSGILGIGPDWRSDFDHCRIDCRAVDAVEVISSADQMPTHTVRFPVHGRYRKQQDLDSVHLGLLNCFGEVVIAGDEKEHIRCTVAGNGPPGRGRSEGQRPSVRR